jgi:hypothetical protein
MRTAQPGYYAAGKAESTLPDPNSQLSDLKDADSMTGISTLLSLEERG